MHLAYTKKKSSGALKIDTKKKRKKEKKKKLKKNKKSSGILTLIKSLMHLVHETCISQVGLMQRIR